MKRLARIAAVAVLALALGACGDSGGDEADTTTTTKASGPAPPTAEVQTESVSFFPKKTRIAKGGTVTWKFTDGNTIHNVTAGDKSWKSPNQSDGEYKHTFDSTGEFKYTCTLHPGMEGVVTVE